MAWPMGLKGTGLCQRAEQKLGRWGESEEKIKWLENVQCENGWMSSKLVLWYYKVRGEEIFKIVNQSVFPGVLRSSKLQVKLESWFVEVFDLMFLMGFQ